MRHKLKSLLPTTHVFEITMRGNSSSKPPVIDPWRSYVELDNRQLSQSHTEYGRLFLREDRILADQNVKLMVERVILPRIQDKIIQNEEVIRQTKKGFKNNVFRMFSSKPTDRWEDDGLMQNYRMNKSESDQMLLIDLSFTVQDYEMVVQNSEYPIKDFNKIKAYKHQTHCQEINLFSRMMTDRSLLTTNFKQFVSMANDIFDSYYNKLK